jgi:hypothetical protein
MRMALAAGGPGRLRTLAVVLIIPLRLLAQAQSFAHPLNRLGTARPFPEDHPPGSGSANCAQRPGYAQKASGMRSTRFTLSRQAPSGAPLQAARKAVQAVPVLSHPPRGPPQVADAARHSLT